MIPKTAILGCVMGAVCLAQQPAFDVASVKMIDEQHPDKAHPSGIGTARATPGRIHLPNVTMTLLLSIAYGVDMGRMSGPDWMRDFMGPNRYTIDATMPPDTTKEQYELMMQNLLAERFQLVVHHETRNFPGYNLVIAKDGPKLKESKPDPNATLPATAQRNPDGSWTFPPGSHWASRMGIGTAHLQAQEETIGELVQRLATAIPVALGGDMLDFSMPHARVTDKTGLTGKYDFTLDYACEGCRGLGTMAANLPAVAAARAQAEARGEAQPASDPAASGLPTIFGALEKQLGLHLEKTRDVPLDVIVVDRAEKVPKAN